MATTRRREEESSMNGYEHEFERAAEELKVAAQRKEVYVSDPQKIKLYGLYKQATEGDCAKPQPSAFQPVERAKWNGWQSLRGMDRIVAKRRYVLQVIELVPSFKMPTERAAPTALSDTGSEPSLSRPSSPTTRVEPARPASPTPSAAAPSELRERRPPVIPQVALPPQRRETQPVPTLPYAMILLELIGLFVGAALVVVIVIKVLLPMCNTVAVEYFEMESCRPMKSLAPLFWFAAGYLLVGALRSKMFAWRLLSGDFVWLSATAPVRRLRRLTRRRRPQAAAVPEETEEERMIKKLKELGIHLVSEPESPQDRWSVPRVELVLPSDPDATSFGHTTVELPFTLEQTANVYYRKFKEPLPDPANPLLVALEDEMQVDLPQWDAVYRRRLMRYKNATPYLIKRFASSDFVEHTEHTLLDKRNRVFYVYGRNRSFTSLGVIEDYTIYKSTDGKPEWTTVTQSARVHITSSSVGFFRSQIESFISNFYSKQAPLARQYHRQRLMEEFGAPESDMTATTTEPDDDDDDDDPQDIRADDEDATTV